MNTMIKSNWKDADYIERLMTFAKIMAKSRTININFRNDEETCFMLCLQADRWGLEPDFVAANSYFDSYGRISQLGKLLKQVLLNNAAIKGITETYSGNWDGIKNAYEVDSDLTVRPKWDVSIEPELKLTVTVTMKDGSQVSEEAVMSDIDPVYRSMNDCWVTRPYFQMSNYVIRQLAYGKLAHLVNGTDSSEAEMEQSAIERQKTLSGAQCRADSVRPDEVERAEEPASEEVVHLEPATKELLKKAEQISQSINNEFIDYQTKEDSIQNWVTNAQREGKALSELQQKIIANQYSKLLKELTESTEEA